MAQMRTLERVIDARINMLNYEERNEIKEDCSFCRKCDHIFDSSTTEGEFQLPMLPVPATVSEQISRSDGPKNLQCIYTFVAAPGQRVKLNFDQFLLAGTAGNCETEYIDIYSELEAADDDLLSASFGGRYCGSVSPYVRISLNRVIVLVFHSRAATSRQSGLKFRGRYAFISDAPYQVGEKVPPGKCDFVIDSKIRKRGSIFSPTYPGTYPKNFRCTYLLNGKTGQRIRLLFRDFDIYFGGEHCPYDSFTIYDGPTNKHPIIRKLCGLQQRMVIYSFGPSTFIEFNTTSPAKADPRGYSLDYEFSSRYVDVLKLMGNQLGITHLRGSECDLLYPLMYPANTTCTFIIDGLQGEQNLEEVILIFEKFAVLTETIDSSNSVQTKHFSTDYDDELCATSYVGIAMLPASIKSVLSSSEESNYDAMLCDRLKDDSPALGPYISNGPRMVLVFSSNERTSDGDGQEPLGFRAKIQFKTDFGIPGQPIGDSNQCMFQFTKPRGWFNSPRYPANYPLDTNCTYIIKAKSDEQIQVYFEQFALYVDEKSSAETRCTDFLEISDVFVKNGREILQLQARYCANTFPGPTVTTFGSHELRVFFRSDHEGTGNGFKAIYQIRKAFAEEIPTKPLPRHCGQRIVRTDEMVSGWIVSPGYPIKYNKDLICDWEITVRPDHQVLLHLVKMEIEGSMTAESVNCQNAVIRVDAECGTRAAPTVQEICGTDESVVQPIVSKNNTVRIRFFTSPDKVNGLKGFNFTWTEVRKTSEDNECVQPSMHLCTYTKLCIDARLKCNGDENCGLHDDTDEANCNKLENAADVRTMLFAGIFSGCLLLLISGLFGYMLKKKLEKRKKKRNSHVNPVRIHQRKPFRNPRQITKADPHLLPAPAASRLTHHNVTTDIIPSSVTEQRNEKPNGETNKNNPSFIHSLRAHVDNSIFYG
uniref:CUB domain-containing protein n=1 Tax=Setaria digitata TaxID=48799 RepID=A0A915Q495_9BILA